MCIQTQQQRSDYSDFFSVSHLIQVADEALISVHEGTTAEDVTQSETVVMNSSEIHTRRPSLMNALIAEIDDDLHRSGDVIDSNRYRNDEIEENCKYLSLRSLSLGKVWRLSICLLREHGLNLCVIIVGLLMFKCQKFCEFVVKACLLWFVCKNIHIWWHFIIVFHYNFLLKINV